MKYSSEDCEPVFTHHFFKKVDHTEDYDLKLLDYVCCAYDNKMWIGIICDINKEEDDVLVKFMHPSLPNTTFTWPDREDMCWVLTNHVKCKISVPITLTGRTYKLSNNDIERTVTKKI